MMEVWYGVLNGLFLYGWVGRGKRFVVTEAGIKVRRINR